MKPVFRSIVAGAAIITAVALAPATAPAYIGADCGAPDGQHLKGDQHLKKMAKELNLSAQQKQQVDGILKKNRAVAEPLMKQLMTERRAMRALVQAETIDEAAIRAQSAKVAAIQADLAVHRAHVAQEIRAVLTPEQIAKAKELQEKRDKKMEERGTNPGKHFKRGR